MLALALGRTVGELKATMSMPEFMMWIEYNKINPIGNRRGDINAALICSTMANVMGGASTKIEDFMLEYGQDDSMDDNQIANFFKGLAATQEV